MKKTGTGWVLVNQDGGIGCLLESSDGRLKRKVNEAAVWRIGLGWPGEQEIAEHKAKGWYVAKCHIEWEAPDKKGDGND